MAEAGGLYIEQRGDGTYEVKREGAGRATAICDTQAEAIARAREIAPGGEIHVERVRDVGDGRDKWRKL